MNKSETVLTGGEPRLDMKQLNLDLPLDKYPCLPFDFDLVSIPDR